MYFSIVGFADLYTDACVRDPAGELLFLSLMGRDTSVLQFLSAFHVKQSAGGMLIGGSAQFELQEQEGRRHTVVVSNPDILEKLSGRLNDPGSILGPITHTFLFDPKVTAPNPQAGEAWMLRHGDWSEQETNTRIWAIVKGLASIPLLEHWRGALLSGLGAELLVCLSDTPAPPLGAVSGFRISMPACFDRLVSTAVATSILTEVAGEQSHDATKRIADLFETLKDLPAESVESPEEVLQSLSRRPPQQEARFDLGALVMTPGVEALMSINPRLPMDCIARHVRGDWGVTSDPEVNEQALVHGNRILSAYPIDPSEASLGYGDNTVWVITEADRSVTTVLLPHEY